MPSKTSWWNKQLVLQIIRSTGWIPIIYFLGLLFALPLEIYRRYENDTRVNFQPQAVDNLFQYSTQIQAAFLIIVPVLMAIFLFRFLHVKSAAEMMHSLPLKREKIFFHYTLSGIVGLILPIIFTALIVIFLYKGIDLSAYFPVEEIFIWAGTAILLNLVLFTAGVLIAMMTGVSVIQAVLTYILLIFPAGFVVLFVSNLHFLWYGFPMDYYLTGKIEEMSPLILISLLDGEVINGKLAAGYTIVALILYGASLYFYKKRKIESASEAIAFSKLRSVFKYGMTFCFTMLGGAYFAAIMESSRIGWLIFGYVIGTVIGYYAAEMILQKTWRVFRKFKGLLLYGASMAVFLLGIQVFDVYEDYLPDVDEIQYVYFSDTPYVFTSDLLNDKYESRPEPLREHSNIEAVRKLHQQIIENKEEQQLDNSDLKEAAFFLYELKNGRKVIREYYVDREELLAYYQAFQETEEYKRATHRIFRLDPKQVKYLTISLQRTAPDYVSLNKRKDIEEFIEIYEKDLLAQKYEDIVYYDSFWASVEFFIDHDYSMYMTLPPSYKGVKQWLDDKDLIEQTSIQPEEISSIEIVKDSYHFAMDPRTIASDIENRADAFVVEDKKQMEELLQSTTGWLRKPQYTVVIRYKSRKQVDVVYMDEKHAPEFVKKYFHK